MWLVVGDQYVNIMHWQIVTSNCNEIFRKIAATRRMIAESQNCFVFHL